ncbi:hypothetical protein [Actinomadura pelletieri]|nr:hypothetical protein [Actinomadura pelletieri]
MAKGATFAEARMRIAAVASRLFGADVRPDRVIGETLRRATTETDPSPDDLRAAMTAVLEQGPARAYEARTADPLFGWIETTFGLRTEDDRFVRRRPRTLPSAAGDMAAFAHEPGDSTAPFVWDEGRRFAMQAEFDAAYSHLYGVSRDDADYIMDSFGAFRRNDPERFARTKTPISDVYDAMAQAMETGEPYETILDPPRRRAAPSRQVGADGQEMPAALVRVELVQGH